MSTTPQSPNPPRRNLFATKPLRIAVAAVVLLCGALFAFKLLKDNTTLSFSFVLDGKPLPVGTAPAVQVDGQPFTSGCTISPGKHKLTADLQIAEPFACRVRVVCGNKNLGALPLESSKGSLIVTVNPSPASVVLRRGIEAAGKGDAPLTVTNLPFGNYDLEIQRGEYKEVRSVKIEGRKRTEVKIDLNLGGVELSSDPADAEFQLSGNGRQWDGKLPILIGDVPVGDYRLTARRKGWEVDTTLSVGRGVMQTNKIEFPYGSIDVSSEPSGLVVSTNGVEIGKTPTVLRELRPGSYVVTTRDGENDLVAMISVGPKENVKKAFVFRYGAVQLASTPAGAAVVRKGKEVGITPLTLERLPAGESAVELRFDGYAPTNFTIVGVEGVTTNYNVKLISKRYLQFMKQASEAIDASHAASQVAESQRFLTNALVFLTNALVAEPNDQVAVALRDEVFQAIVKAEETERAAEKVKLETEKKKEEELKAKLAEAKKQEIASLPWLDFKKVISDCTDTKQVEYSVEMDDGYYEDYLDNNGKRKQRFHKTGQHSETRTRTESSFNPITFSAQYGGRTFRFNCPDKWSVSKVEKEGGIIFKAGGFTLVPETIRATAPTSNRDALISLQKGQKVTIKGVLKKYEWKAFGAPTLYLEDAELLDK